MLFSEFQDLVQSRRPEFEGAAKLSDAELEVAESSLGVTLPTSLTWLLKTHGYSGACGVDSLTQSVAATLRCRETIQLPHHIVVLNDWNDAGVVFLDFGRTTSTGEPAVVWTGAHNLNRLAAGQEMDSDRDEFDDFSAWAISRANELSEDGF